MCEQGEAGISAVALQYRRGVGIYRTQNHISMYHIAEPCGEKGVERFDGFLRRIAAAEVDQDALDRALPGRAILALLAKFRSQQCIARAE